MSKQEVLLSLIQVRAERDLRKAVEAAAGRAGISLSGYVRRELRAAIARPSTGAPEIGARP